MRPAAAQRTTEHTIDNHMWSLINGTKPNMSVTRKAPANRYTGISPSQMVLVNIINATINDRSRMDAAMTAANVILYLKSVLIRSTSKCGSNCFNYFISREEIVMFNSFDSNKACTAAGKLTKQTSGRVDRYDLIIL